MDKSLACCVVIRMSIYACKYIPPDIMLIVLYRLKYSTILVLMSYFFELVHYNQHNLLSILYTIVSNTRIDTIHFKYCVYSDVG